MLLKQLIKWTGWLVGFLNNTVLCDLALRSAFCVNDSIRTHVQNNDDKLTLVETWSRLKLWTQFLTLHEATSYMYVSMYNPFFLCIRHLISSASLLSRRIVWARNCWPHVVCSFFFNPRGSSSVHRRFVRKRMISFEYSLSRGKV